MNKFSHGLLFVALTGCGAGSTSTADIPEPDVYRSGPLPSATGPCGDGGWGGIANAADAVHVRAGGSDATGTGTPTEPFASLAKAVDAVEWRRGRPPSDVYIALGPGTYDATLDLDKHGNNPRLHIEGCSPDEVVLRATDPTRPAIAVDHRGLTLRGVEVRGGQVGVYADKHADVLLDEVRVREASRIGVYGRHHADVTLTDVHVVGTQQDADGYGWGLAFAHKADASLSGVRVSDMTGIGIFADDSDLELNEVIVEWTKVQDDGSLGRGIHLQNKATARVYDSVLVGNHDAGIFALDSGFIEVGRIIIDITGAGIIWGGFRDDIIIDLPNAGIIYDPKKSTGDGIVLYGKDHDFDAVLYDNEIYESKRSALLVSGTEADVSGTTAVNNGFEIDGTSMFRQGGAAVHGADAPRVRALELDDTLPVRGNPLVVP